MCTTCVNLSCFGRLGHSCSYNTGGPGTIHPKSARCPLFAELQSECACRGAHRRGTKRSRVSDFEAARAAMVFWAAVPRMLDRTDMAVCQNLVPLVNIKIAGKWMFIPLKMVLIGIDPYPYELMTCSLLTKMEQDGTRWNKVHMPWNPSTWFCDPSPPCPKLLPFANLGTEGWEDTRSESHHWSQHHHHNIRTSVPSDPSAACGDPPYPQRSHKVQETPQTSPTTFWRPRACPGAWHSESAAVSGVPSLHPQLQGQPGHQGYPNFSKRCWEPFFWFFELPFRSKHRYLLQWKCCFFPHPPIITNLLTMASWHISPGFSPCHAQALTAICPSAQPSGLMDHAPSKLPTSEGYDWPEFLAETTHRNLFPDFWVEKLTEKSRKSQSFRGKCQQYGEQNDFSFPVDFPTWIIALFHHIMACYGRCVMVDWWWFTC